MCGHLLVMSDKLGRRKTIISGGLMFVVGGSVQSAAVQIWSIHYKSLTAKNDYLII